MAFVRKYLENGGRPTVAARAAGYEFPGPEGARCLKHPKIAAEIAKRTKRLEDKHNVTMDRVVKEWEKLAFTDIASLLDIDDESGEANWDLREMTVAQRSCMAGFELIEFKEGKGVFSQDKRKTKITFHNKQAALDCLARVLGGYNDSIDVNEGLSRAERVSAGRTRAAMRNKED